MSYIFWNMFSTSPWWFCNGWTSAYRCVFKVGSSSSVFPRKPTMDRESIFENHITPGPVVTAHRSGLNGKWWTPPVSTGNAVVYLKLLKACGIRVSVCYHFSWLSIVKNKIPGGKHHRTWHGEIGPNCLGASPWCPVRASVPGSAQRCLKYEEKQWTILRKTRHKKLSPGKQ